MSYVVLARKYRPMRFADMVGQEHIGRTLGNAIRQDRVHHAYLFTGARGLGKTTTARIFAKALVCERGPTAEPCNECAQCVAVTEGRSVDVIEIDGASNNSVENIRNLREQVHYLPQTARRKVYIIDEVHMLTTSAFNALLKTLEEPPAHVNFVFATTEPHKVLPTILSRVSRLDFRRLGVPELVAHLQTILAKEQLAIDEGGLRLIARAAGGSVRDAMTLLDQVIAFADDPTKITEVEARTVLGQAQRPAIAALVDALLARDATETLRLFDALTAAGHDLTVLSLQMLEELRDLTVARVCRTDEAFVDATADEISELRGRAAAHEPIALMQVFDRLGRIIDRLPQARAQRTVLEMGLLELAQSEPLVPLGDLIERLGNIAGGGSAPSAPSSSRGSSGGSARPAPTRSGSRASAEDEPPRASVRATAHDDAREPPPPEPSLAIASEPVPPPVVPEPPVQTREPAVAVAPEPPAAPAPGPEMPSAFAKELWAKFQGSVGPESTRAEPPPPAPPVEPPRPMPPPVVAPRSNGAEAAPRSNGTGAAPRSNGTPVPARATGSPIAPVPAPADPAHAASWPLLDETASYAMIDDAATFQAWERFVGVVREDDEYASAVLRELGLMAFSGGILRVVAPRSSFAHTEISGDMRARIEQAAREHTGVPVTLELVDGNPRLPDVPSLELVTRRRRDDLRRVAEAEARAHPAIAALLQTFDGHLAATRPLHEP